ncbi:hypothetical protein QQS21_011846 [Conoideocrella luteorostrata]|uniref:Glycosyltransferase 2 n=1 Tax=Conoideocrella luteorostrata TaxID=1105319 RepID=A0AAJ0FTA7_9HYPO|nr:hypothetical protein QQS21_011846 [Conoideocrella luteorostrata]
MVTSRGWQIWRDDEEMAKKDDDHILPSHSRNKTWKAARLSQPARVKRFAAYALVIMAVFYLFTRDSTITDSFPSSGGTDNRDPIERAYEDRFQPGKPSNVDYTTTDPYPSHPHGSPQTPASNQQAQHHRSKPKPKYDGPIKYPALASSLRAVAEIGGASHKNRNVLFAAASLKSSSTLLPMACEMAMERQSYVHFVFMGMADIDLKELLEINGIDKSCQLVLHDARPDYFGLSTEHRISLAITKAFLYINTYIHPQAILIDSTKDEEDYFLHPARDQISATEAALIELPERPNTSLSWISKLDSAALSAWNKVRFDILIHATPTKTGNLKRLLMSIAKADLAGIQIPHITIELPNAIEQSLESYLRDFRWPRSTVRDGDHAQLVSLRRRITTHRLDEEDSSVRFLESFWPTDPASSHVLVLSPHTEITPQFFQYVKYSLLHRLHSKMAQMEDFEPNMMGLSLSVPNTLIDGTTAFSPPSSAGSAKGASRQAAFLWQRPSSEAMVILGEKWVELHHFVAQTLHQKRTLSSTPALLTKKEVSKKYPAWLEYVLQLSRLRGYYMLYPSQDTARAIIGVHSDVPDPPEEYELDASRKATSSKNSIDDDHEYFDPVSPVNMLETLPEKGALPSLADLPLLSWDGKVKTARDVAIGADEYTTSFRREVGGCSEGDMKSILLRKQDAMDLFCRDAK